MPTILVIDDQAANRDLLNALLSSRGYRILEAADGIQGLKAARGARPDLILTDIVMPNMKISDRTEVMAASYGVKYVFGVPTAPEVIFKAVEIVLKNAKREAQSTGSLSKEL